MPRACAAFAALCGVAALPALAAVPPTVTLTDTPLQNNLLVGDSTTITVSAVVSNASANDGIVEFDLDLFPLIKSGIHFTSLATLDPHATLVSAGTSDSTTGGILGITGLYTPNGQGIGTPVNLFTVQLHADTAGANSVSAGLSVYPNGTGIPFQLNVSGDYVDPSSGTPPFLVDSSGAIAHLSVSAAPEPSTALFCLSLLTPALLKRRRAHS
jgi:hypothetical protein